MSPDTPETRIARLEQQVAKLEQRVEDLLTTIAVQFKTLNEDVRSFMPMVREVDNLRHQMTLAHNEAKAARDEIAELRRSLEERAERQQQERKSDRRWLVGTVLTSAGLIILAIQVLGGFA
jgi:predicted  nucleic acid-binding Zn-ribbon protein